MSLHPRRGLLCFPRKNEYFHRENGAYFRENVAFSNKNGRFSCKNYFGVLRLSPVFTFGRPAGRIFRAGGVNSRALALAFALFCSPYLVEKTIPSGARLVYLLVKKTIPKGKHTPRPCFVHIESPPRVSPQQKQRGVFVRLTTAPVLLCGVEVSPSFHTNTKKRPPSVQGGRYLANDENDTCKNTIF